ETTVVLAECSTDLEGAKIKAAPPKVPAQGLGCGKTLGAGDRALRVRLQISNATKMHDRALIVERLAWTPEQRLEAGVGAEPAGTLPLGEPLGFTCGPKLPIKARGLRSGRSPRR